MPNAPEPTALLLRRVGQGDPAARGELVERLGSEMRNLARAHFRRAKGNVLLQPTVLVNEVWLRLAEREGLSFQNRCAFLGFASKVMRNLLADAARAWLRRRDQSEGGRVSLTDVRFDEEAESVELLDVDQALSRLETQDAQSARIVELRFFGGLEHRDIAELLGVSERTVDRRWRFARAWLRTQLSA